MIRQSRLERYIGNKFRLVYRMSGFMCSIKTNRKVSLAWRGVGMAIRLMSIRLMASRLRITLPSVWKSAWSERCQDQCRCFASGDEQTGTLSLSQKSPKSILVTISEFKSDTYINTKFDYSVRVDVYQDGQLLATKRVEGPEKSGRQFYRSVFACERGIASCLQENFPWITGLLPRLQNIFWSNLTFSWQRVNPENMKTVFCLFW